VALACLVVAATAIAATAQSGPFGMSRPPAAPADGLAAWIFAKQAAFYRDLSAAIRAAKADGSALWGLLGISFLYGVFHAAGPGHGKAVISAYLVANEESWRRGVVLAFASALLQALVAIAIVAIAAALLGATARTMTEAVRVIEIASYALIATIGARLLWRKGRAFLAALGVAMVRPAWAAAGSPPRVDAQAHAHAGRAVGHDHAHVHGPGCGHAHGPDPKELTGPGGWSRGLPAIVAVGLRPCSGAILVLVFALAQGLFWAGVGASLVMGLGTALTVAVIATLAASAKGIARKLAHSRAGAGVLVMLGLETAAAGLVLAFGLLLLFGYMASERLMGM
jgi:ABC-type nickel/cobalt efflux system permease component RcnA